MGLLYPPNKLPNCLDGSEAICRQGPDFDKLVFKKESSTSSNNSNNILYLDVFLLQCSFQFLQGNDTRYINVCHRCNIAHTMWVLYKLQLQSHLTYSYHHQKNLVCNWTIIDRKNLKVKSKGMSDLVQVLSNSMRILQLEKTQNSIK